MFHSKFTEFSQIQGKMLVVVWFAFFFKFKCFQKYRCNNY